MYDFRSMQKWHLGSGACDHIADVCQAGAVVANGVANLREQLDTLCATGIRKAATINVFWSELANILGNPNVVVPKPI